MAQCEGFLSTFVEWHLDLPIMPRSGPDFVENVFFEPVPPLLVDTDAIVLSFLESVVSGRLDYPVSFIM